MSTSFVGIANRSFICGRSECPPASSFASVVGLQQPRSRHRPNRPARTRTAPGSCRTSVCLAAWIARHTRSGDAGFSIAVTPRCETASITAFTTAGGAAIVPASPIPFTPSGFVLDGVA